MAVQTTMLAVSGSVEAARAGDAGRGFAGVSRAIRNLAENAIAHTGQGTEVEIEVDANGTMRVLDRGSGIAEQDRELIFQRFWRGDRKKPGGAGLGLSIVQGIVRAAGGTIAVSNRAGGGAEFIARFVRAEPGDDGRAIRR